MRRAAFSWSLAFAAAALAAVLAMSNSACAQTFHYSHGWTNGKRAAAAPLDAAKRAAILRGAGDSLLMRRLVRQGDGEEEEDGQELDNLIPRPNLRMLRPRMYEADDNNNDDDDDISGGGAGEDGIHGGQGIKDQISMVLLARASGKDKSTGETLFKLYRLTSRDK